MDLCSFESVGIVDDVVSQCGLVERLDGWLVSVHRAKARAGVRENGQREFRQAAQTPGQVGCCGLSELGREGGGGGRGGEGNVRSVSGRREWRRWGGDGCLFLVGRLLRKRKGGRSWVLGKGRR